MEKKQTRIISAKELKSCPQSILAPSHWIPKHKTEECSNRKSKKQKEKHLCQKRDIRWDLEPELGGGEGISWFGTCRICKKRVLEQYVQGDELFDAKTLETITN